MNATAPVPGAEKNEAASRAVVVSALGIAQILAWGSSYYLPAVLAAPIAASTGWPLSWVVGGLSLGLFISGAVSPQVGRIIERRGGRPVLMASAVLLAGGLILLALSETIAVYLAAWAAIGLGMGAGLYDAAFAMLGRRYGMAARGTITALTLWGGFASTVCWPLSALLVATVGWRGACLVYAAIHLTVVLLLYCFLLPREEIRAAPPPAAAARDEASPAPSLAHPGLVFALLAAGLTLGAVISTVVAVHLLTMLQARDVALGAAVALGALVGPSQVGARLIEMLIGRHYHPMWTMLASTILTTVGLAILFAGVGAIAVGLVLYGAGIGIKSIARGTLPLALFGSSGYAAMMGRLAMPSFIAQSLSPAIGALLLEHYGAAPTLAVLVGAALVNVLLVVALWACARR